MDTKNARMMLGLIEEVLDKYENDEKDIDQARKEVTALAAGLAEDQGVANIYLEWEGEEDNWLPDDQAVYEVDPERTYDEPPVFPEH